MSVIEQWYHLDISQDISSIWGPVGEKTPLAKCNLLRWLGHGFCRSCSHWTLPCATSPACFKATTMSGELSVLWVSGLPPAYLLQQLRIFTVHADWPNLEWSVNSDELSGFVWTYALQILYLLVILMKVVVNCAMAGHGPAVLSPAGKGELNTWKRQGFFCQVPFETLGTSVSTWSIWNIQTKSHLNVSLSKCKVQYKFRGLQMAWNCMITINP